MNFEECLNDRTGILMEGALGERLKREFQLGFDENVGMAGLIFSESGRQALSQLWSEYANISFAYNLPFLAMTPTRRTNKESVENGCFDSSIVKANVDFLRKVQRQQTTEMYVGGLLGCKGDAYTGRPSLGLKESENFHTWEAELFAESKVDFLYAALMPDVKEAAGMAMAIGKLKIPYIIGFTIGKDGRLIDGTSIADAIQYIDGSTVYSPVCYMASCAHPQNVYEALTQSFNCNEVVYTRFLGIQANTSPLPYNALDNAADLKTAEPVEFAKEILRLREINPIKIFGGCCGTDGRHMREIAKQLSR